MCGRLFDPNMIIIILLFLPLTTCREHDLFVKSSNGVRLFSPPIISVDSPEIDIESNSSLELECVGKHPITWRVPSTWADNISERLDLCSEYDPNRIDNKYVSHLRVNRTEYLDTGRYFCYYNASRQSSPVLTPENSTSVYVFVNDNEELFLPDPKFGNILFTVVKPSVPTRVDCLPTSSEVNVTLWKIINDEEAVQVQESADVLYDPTEGFMLLYPNIYFSGLFQCRGVLNRFKGSVNITFFYLPDPQHLPQPMINGSAAKYPIVNGTFFLSCTVKVEPSTMVRMEWQYPNKGSSRIVETNATMKERKNLHNYVYREVVQKLIVHDAELGDTGRYMCLVTDHSHKHNSHSIHVTVHEKRQPHVNFTTDVEKGSAIVRLMGKEAKMVVTVSAFPGMDAIKMQWEKDGQPLKKGNRHQMQQTSNQVILLIDHLERSDTGNYTLFGKMEENVLASIGFQLLIKAQPLVEILDSQSFYRHNHVSYLSCRVRGYPAPVVWWKWRPCRRPNSCVPDSQYGWMDLEPHRRSSNDEVHTEVKGLDTVIYNLTVQPTESGYYKCSGTNDLGSEDRRIAFVVMDASSGFEVNSSVLEPIEGDEVILTCRASSFNYSRTVWYKQTSKEGLPVKISDDEQGLSLTLSKTPYSHLLTIKFGAISTNDSGRYVCQVWNLDSSQFWKKSLYLHVNGMIGPYVIETNMNGQTKSVEPAERYTFVCNVSGVPEPEVTWYKNEQEYDVSNISGVDLIGNNLEFKRLVEMDSGRYSCLARNRGGTLKLSSVIDVLKTDFKAQDSTTLIGIVCTVVVFSVVLIVVAVILLKKICKEKKEKREMEFFSHALFNRGQVEMFNPDLGFDDQVDLLPYDPKWEFPKERLKLGKTLGQGAFGRVVKADAIGLDDGETKTTVAVKMLKERADSAQRKALMAELKILIHIGSHVNIVNLLGAVTKNLAKGELMVMMEYCCFGNVRNYLLRHRACYVDQVDRRTGKIDPELCNLPGTPSSPKDVQFTDVGWSNPTYGQDALNYADLAHVCTSDVTEPSSPASPTRSEKSSLGGTLGRGYCCQQGRHNNHFVTTSNLMCYAFQCARGMAYLSSRKLIHRDLAARNVLLAEDNIVKICDFGLAKDCYKYSNYVKKGDGPLPIKWMAVESIGDKIFTTKSDVWSFGILLWELFTLGGNPYPGIDIDENFYKKLRSGYVMEKPDYCPVDVYQIMTNCWTTDPEKRSSFTELSDKLGGFLEEGLRKYYVDLNNPYMELNEQMRNDYLSMSGTNEEYLSMKVDSEPDSHLEQHYDNIGSVRPVGDGPVPIEPMEVVPMIHFDICNSWSGEPSSPIVSSIPSDYLVMGKSDSANFDRTRKENVSTRSDASSGFHSDPGNCSDYPVSISPPPYDLVAGDSRHGIAV